MSPARPATSNSRRRQRHYERGSASIELVILLPALFALMFLGIQAALYYHARTLAIAAAQEGARAAAAQNGPPGIGVNAANTFLADSARDALTGTTATVISTPAQVTVTVTGFSLSVIPGWSPKITQSATAPVERLTAP